MEKQFNIDKFNEDLENPEDIIKAFEDESKLEINKRKNPDYFYSTRRRYLKYLIYKIFLL